MTEHKYGSEVVQLICNIALMTGKVGRARLGAAAAARAEQRPGLLRHGRAAGHVHRLPLGRRRGGRAALRGRVGRARSRARRADTIPQMFDAAVAGDLKAMYIFGEDVAQTDPNTAHVVAALENLEFLRLPGHLRDRDDEVRGRDPARLVVPGEARHVHQRRAARSSSSTPAIEPPGRRARPTSRSSRRVSARARPRAAVGRRRRTRWTRSPR